jgi:hypothetical protein
VIYAPPGALYPARRFKMKAMQPELEIRVTYTADSLDTTGALTREHIASYADSLKDYLAVEFPDAEIKVALGDDDDIRVYTQGYNRTMKMQERVHHAMEDHYPEWIEEIAGHFQ